VSAWLDIDTIAVNRERKNVKKFIFVTILVTSLLLSACAKSSIAVPTDTPAPTQTIATTPTLSDLIKSQVLKFVEGTTKLKSMTTEGVNFVNYSEQLAEVNGAYELLIAIWGGDIDITTKENIEKALEGWGNARLLWDLKINHKYAVSNSGRTREYFQKIYDYAGDRLTLTQAGKIMPYDENISILFAIANEYFEKAQPDLLGVIQQ
jgi:hypothetical protein